MTQHSIARLCANALTATIFVVFISMTNGCAAITDSTNEKIINGSIKNESILHKDRYASHASHASHEGANEDMFLVAIEAQRAYQESRWLEAVSLYQQIVERLPNDAVTWFRLANTYAQQGAFERAIHAYEQSLALDKEQPKAWFNLSTAYLLNAKSAMLNAHNGMRSHDPARAMIQGRLEALSDLVNHRLEESTGFPPPRE